VARCDIPRAQCLNWHIRDCLRDPKESGDRLGGVVASYRALCPSHPDSEHSLSVSVGEKARIVWHCYTKDIHGKLLCSPLAIRAALIRDGCEADCLGMPKDDEQDLIDQLAKLYAAGLHHSELRWRIFSLVQGFGGELPPKGRYLGGRRKFAADAGVAQPDLYRAKNR
jgi:hypothetical protein